MNEKQSLGQSLSFISHGHTIRANLAVPNPEAPCIIMSHGLEGSKDGKKWLEFVPRLISTGYSCFRFNYRGCGSGKEYSDGEFPNSTLSSRIQDYKAAIDFIQASEIGENGTGVIGSSFGGSVAIAARDKRVKAMVILATPCKLKIPSYNKSKDFKQKGSHELPSGRKLFPNFFSDFNSYNLCRAVREICCPLLIIQGDADKLVSLNNAYDFYKNSYEPKQLEIINGADHSFSEPRHLEKVIALTVDWFRLYL
jgi:alpha/beta superfamily hydrolase